MKVIGSAAKTVFYLKKMQDQSPSWRLQYKIKCKSTENELINIAKEVGFKKAEYRTILWGQMGRLILTQ